MGCCWVLRVVLWVVVTGSWSVRASRMLKAICGGATGKGFNLSWFWDVWLGTRSVWWVSVVKRARGPRSCL